MYKPIVGVSLALLVVVVLAVGVSAQTNTTEYLEFGFDSPAWGCSSADGSLLVVDCSSGGFPVAASLVGLALFPRGEGVITARVWAGGVVVCENSRTVDHASVRFDFICSPSSGVPAGWSVQLVNGGGFVVADFLRVDWSPVVAVVPTVVIPTPAPVSAPVIAAASVAAPPPAAAPVYVVSGQPLAAAAVGGAAPATECRVFLRVFSAAGVLVSHPVDVEYVGSTGFSVGVDRGYASLMVPCGVAFFVVRSKDSGSVSVPLLVTVREGVAVDLAFVDAPPVAQEEQSIPAESPTPAPGVDWGSLDFFNPSNLGDPNSLGGLKLVGASAVGVRVPVSDTSSPAIQTVATIEKPVFDADENRSFFENLPGIRSLNFDWPIVIGFMALVFLVIRVVGFFRRD